MKSINNTDNDVSESELREQLKSISDTVNRTQIRLRKLISACEADIDACSNPSKLETATETG